MIGFQKQRSEVMAIHVRFVLLALGLIASVFHSAIAQDEARTLKVKVHYTGSGTVDEQHKIFTFLFGSPQFTHGGDIPFAMRYIASKESVVTFSNVDRSPVYVGTVYDASGKFDGQSSPPSGSALGAYSTDSEKPAPVKLEEGKTVEIEMSFDDSAKVP
jgi:hypothetical protein